MKLPTALTPDIFLPREIRHLQTLDTETRMATVEAFTVCNREILADSQFRFSLPGSIPCGRTSKQQQALFAKGRRRLPNGLWVVVDEHAIVTNCDGITMLSNHQESPKGHAVDAGVRYRVCDRFIYDGDEAPEEARQVFLLCVAEMKAVGFAWGGDWRGRLKDRNHFEFKRR